MQVTGEVHSQGSWCGVQHGSELLPLFSSSRSLVLSHEPMLPPSRCCGWWCGHIQLSRFSHPPSLLLACVHLFWSSMFFWSLKCIPYSNPCREPARALLFRDLLLHFHKLLFQCTLGLEDSCNCKERTGHLNLLTEAPHIRDVQHLQWFLFFWWLSTYLLSPGLA